MPLQVTSRDHVIKQPCDFVDRKTLTISDHSVKFDGHTLCESVNVTMETTTDFYDLKTLLYLVIKEKLSRRGLLDHILCEWWLLRHYLE